MTLGLTEDDQMRPLSASQERDGRASISSTAKPHSREQLSWLQCGRAMAALIVAVYHASMNVGAVSNPSSPDVAYLFRFGNAGVDLFFVISGFIIMHAHRDDIGRPDRLPRYLWRRTTRIYPLYWVLCAFVIPLYFVFPSAGAGWQREIGSILGSIALLPASKSIIGVAWSLVLEMIFYAMFALLIINKRVGGFLFTAWIVAASSTLIFGRPEMYPLGPLLSHFFFCFFLGIVVALVYRRFPSKFAQTTFVAGIFLFLASGAALVIAGVGHVDRPALFDAAFALSSAAIVAGLVMIDRAGRWPAPAILVLIGNASYSMYLFHWLVGWFIERGVIALGFRGQFSSLWLLPTTIILMIGASYMVYLCVEKPLMQLSRAIWTRWHQRNSAVSS